MKEVVVDTSVTGLLVSATIMMAVIVLLSLIAMTLMYRYFHQVSKQQGKIIEALQNDVTALHSETKMLSTRFTRSENKFKQLARRQYLYEVQQMKNKNYARAKSMITQGEKVSAVVQNCRITRTEAELIMLANRMNKVA